MSLGATGDVIRNNIIKIVGKPLNRKENEVVQILTTIFQDLKIIFFLATFSFRFLSLRFNNFKFLFFSCSKTEKDDIITMFCHFIYVDF